MAEHNVVTHGETEDGEKHQHKPDPNSTVPRPYKKDKKRAKLAESPQKMKDNTSHPDISSEKKQKKKRKREREQVEPSEVSVAPAKLHPPSVLAEKEKEQASQPNGEKEAAAAETSTKRRRRPAPAELFTAKEKSLIVQAVKEHMAEHNLSIDEMLVKNGGRGKRNRWKSIAALLENRKPDSVRKCAVILLGGNTKGKWSEEDVERVIQLHKQGYTNAEIGRELKRTNTAVNGLLRSMNINYERVTSRMNKMPEEEVTLLRDAICEQIDGKFNLDNIGHSNINMDKIQRESFPQYTVKMLENVFNRKIAPQILGARENAKPALSHRWKDSHTAQLCFRLDAACTRHQTIHDIAWRSICWGRFAPGVTAGPDMKTRWKQELQRFNVDESLLVTEQTELVLSSLDQALVQRVSEAMRKHGLDMDQENSNTKGEEVDKAHEPAPAMITTNSAVAHAIGEEWVKEKDQDGRKKKKDGERDEKKRMKKKKRERVAEDGAKAMVVES